MSRSTPTTTLLETLAQVEALGKVGAAAHLGCSVRTIERRIKAAREGGLGESGEPSESPQPGWEVEAQPDGEEPLEDLLERRTARYERRARASKEEVVVRIKEPGPFGILVMGDPHIDDDGCDLPLLRSHVEIIQATEGLYGACVGDMQNNWVGRLARLYGEQGTTTREAWRLVEWLVGSVPWLLLVRGNHDAWGGSGDPLDWIVKSRKVAADGPHEVKVRLDFKGGQKPIRIWARHSFPGRSQWSKTHGPAKAALMGGYPADVLLSGHWHTWESRSGERTDGSVFHALQVGSYKRGDSYGMALGLPEAHHGSAALLVFDPDLPDGPGRVRVFWDARAGAEFLTWLRSR